MQMLPREQVWLAAPRPDPADGLGWGVPAVQSCQVSCKLALNMK